MIEEMLEELRGLVYGRNIVIKKADKGSWVVVWCREDQITEANKQLEKNTI